MNAFKAAVKEMFSNRDFLEQAVIDGSTVDVVVSKVTDNVTWAETGSENPSDFTLLVDADSIKKPKMNAKVIFRGDTYKISYSELDSAGASYKLYLVETSTGIK